MKGCKIIQNQCYSEYTERGSRFLGLLHFLDSIKEYRLELKKIKSEHLKSTHVCSAYRIINDNNIEEKCSDDGEPSRSAGLPILNELKRQSIVNVGAFIVRYYGGVKLGIPGLIHSYTEASRIAISNSILLDWEPFKTYTLNHSYQEIDMIDFLIKKYKAKLVDREFDLFVRSSIKINNDLIDNFKDSIQHKLSKTILLIEQE